MDTNAPRQAVVAATPDDELIRILGNSLYPGARPESIRLVLAWCKATGRDPMKRPIHIVPMEVTDKATGQKAWRDVLMPGIGTYRTDAANSGAYGGIDEPEFGPDVTEQIDNVSVTYPKWCKTTVYRLVGNEKRAFTAKEYWIENYASGYQGKGVNAMWRKRPYGQLAKVAEAQALRKAFPDETGQTNTTDEMEGKTFAGETIDGVADDTPKRETKREQHRPIKSEVYETDPATGETTKAMQETFLERAEISLVEQKNPTSWLKTLDAVFAQAPTLDDIAALRDFKMVKDAMANAPSLIRGRIDDMVKAAVARLASLQQPADEKSEKGMWDAPANGNGSHGDLEGNGTNHTKAEASAVQGEVSTVAGALKADKPDEEREWMPGDP